MDKHGFSILLSNSFAILFTCSIACFNYTVLFYCVKQDESEENEDSTGIEMQDL